MIGWFARDARRTTQQLYRLTRRWPLHTTITAVALTALAVIRPLWGVPLLVALWAITEPTRRMWRPRLRVALKDAGLTPPPHITPGTLRHQPYGMSATLTLKRGQNHKDLHTRTPTIAAHLDVRDVTIEPDLNRKGHALLDIVERLPWTPGERITWPWATHTHTSVWDPVPVAVDMRLQPVTWQLCAPNRGGTGILTGGIPGAGKSTFLHLIIATAALDPDCELVLLDGKQAEMHQWRDVASHYVGFDLDAAIRALEHVDHWVDRRLEWLEQHGRRVVREDEPTIALVCDEQGSYTSTVDREGGDRFEALLERITQRSRAVGGIVALGTQKAAADVIRTSIRDLLAYRAGFRALTPEASDMVMGKGMAHNGYSAVDIPHDQPGVGWFNPAGELPRLCKSYALTDEQLQVLAGHAPTPARPAEAKSEPRHLRPVPDNDREAIRAPRS